MPKAKKFAKYSEYVLLSICPRSKAMPKIYFIDVTNRDGVQTAKLGLSKIEKTLINVYLNEMGIFQSEFGFPTTRHESLYPSQNKTKLLYW